jgi:hypothetical protein
LENLVQNTLSNFFIKKKSWKENRGTLGIFRVLFIGRKIEEL